jgi:hypothetical protein
MGSSIEPPETRVWFPNYLVLTRVRYPRQSIPNRQPNGLDLMSDSEFTPLGPEKALKTAVAILDPGSNGIIRGERVTKRRHQRNFFDTFNVRDFNREYLDCCAIGATYQGVVTLDKNGTLPNAFFGQLADIANYSAALVKIFREMKPDTHFLLTTVFDNDERTFFRLSDLLWKTGRILPKEPRLLSKPLENLDAVAKYLDFYIPVLRDRLAANSIEHRPNAPSVGRISGQSPLWWLIGASWELFSKYPHLKPSGVENGALHEFVRAIHTWVTGDSEKTYAKAVKKYAGLQNRRRRLQRELKEHLGRPRPLSQSPIAQRNRETPREHGNQTRQNAIRQLERELSEIEYHLHFEYRPDEKRKK